MNNAEALETYKIFGAALSTSFQFATPLIQMTDELVVTNSKPDLIFDIVDDLTTGILNKDEPSLLQFSQSADFYVWPDRISCHLLAPQDPYLIEIQVLGSVLAFWLEMRTLPALHASAVSCQGNAIAFLAANKGGKSSLAAALMQSGHPLLTDDIFPIDLFEGCYYTRPSYPSMRIWPEEALHFLGGVEDLDLIHPQISKRRVPVGENGFGTFCDSAQPINRVYIPERRDPKEWGEEIEITPLPSRDVLIALIRYSFLANLVEKKGLQPKRLPILAGLAKTVPFFKLVYPAGYDLLPKVRDAILADIGSSY